MGRLSTAEADAAWRRRASCGARGCPGAGDWLVLVGGRALRQPGSDQIMEQGENILLGAVGRNLVGAAQGVTKLGHGMRLPQALPQQPAGAAETRRLPRPAISAAAYHGRQVSKDF